MSTKHWSSGILAFRSGIGDTTPNIRHPAPTEKLIWAAGGHNWRPAIEHYRQLELYASNQHLWWWRVLYGLDPNTACSFSQTGVVFAIFSVLPVIGFITIWHQWAFLSTLGGQAAACGFIAGIALAAYIISMPRKADYWVWITLKNFDESHKALGLPPMPQSVRTTINNCKLMLVDPLFYVEYKRNDSILHVSSVDLKTGKRTAYHPCCAWNWDGELFP